MNEQGCSLNKDSRIFCHVAGYEIVDQEPSYDAARSLPFCKHCVKSGLGVTNLAPKGQDYFLWK